MARIDANLRAKFVSPVRQKPRLAQSLQRGTIARNSFAMSEGSSGREFVGSNLQRRTAGRDETHKTGRRGLLFRFALPLDLLGSATNPILDVGLFLAGEDFRFNHHHFSKSWVLDRQPRSSGSACEPPGGNPCTGRIRRSAVEYKASLCPAKGINPKTGG